MRPRGLMQALSLMAALAPEPGQRKNRKRRRRKKVRTDGLKHRCRTLERYRLTRASLAPPIRSRSSIRREALRKAYAAAGFHVEWEPRELAS